MGGLFGGSSPAPAPIPPPPPPTRSDAEVQQAGLDARRRRASAQGRSSIIRTSGQGLTESGQIATKVLLGQ